jgi:hypothetical protein
MNKLRDRGSVACGRGKGSRKSLIARVKFAAGGCCEAASPHARLALSSGSSRVAADNFPSTLSVYPPRLIIAAPRWKSSAVISPSSVSAPYQGR